MRKKGAVLLLGLIVVVAGYWVIVSGSHAQPSEGVVDLWATWGDDAGQLQALLDGDGRTGAAPVRITTRVRSDDLLEALTGPEPPDLVILSSADFVEAYHRQGLVEPLDGWIQAGGIEPGDMVPAALAQCREPGGATLCLPWGCDADALFWNKDLFAAAGLDPERPPRTMEELVEYAAKLTVRDETGKLSQAGFLPDFPRSHADLYIQMFAGALYKEGDAALAANSRPVIESMNWQRQFHDLYAPEEVKDLVSSFTPYMNSRHPLYAGRRLGCQQCHRASPVDKAKTPDTGFSEGKIAMMVDGQWQASLPSYSREESRINYGVAPFPPPVAHPEQANTTVVRGPVIIVPAGAIDKEAAVHLLAWLVSPDMMAEAAIANSLLPASRLATQDPRFGETPHFELFMDLVNHPGTRAAITTPISPELNQALSQVEAEILHSGGDPAPLLDQVQAGYAPKLAAPSNDGGGP